MRRMHVFIVTAIVLAAIMGPGARAQDTPHPADGAPRLADQSVLGPGLYVFQTRTIGATCGDDDRNGYVASFMASINGVPGSRAMDMRLLDSPYWTTWTLSITDAGEVLGESFFNGSTGADRPVNRFHVTRNHGRFTGDGSRSYMGTLNGQPHRCEVTFEALLRRIDV